MGHQSRLQSLRRELRAGSEVYPAGVSDGLTRRNVSRSLRIAHPPASSMPPRVTIGGHDVGPAARVVGPPEAHIVASWQHVNDERCPAKTLRRRAKQAAKAKGETHP